MKVKMIQTKTAASDPSGVQAMTYEAGKEYDVHEELAQVFLKEGWAKKVEKPKEKDLKGPKENKDLEGVEETKEEEAPGKKK